MPGFLPYARQSIDEADIAAVVAVLRGDWLTTGPAVTAFEAELAAATGVRHALSCSSGTAALHLACAALDLAPGDAAIVPSITFLATANAVRYLGAEPVFADVDPETGLLTEAALAEALDRAEGAGLTPRAVFPVHLAGQCCDLAALARIAAARGAVLVEDACHAIGTRHVLPDGTTEPVGACRWSAMAVFSFHAVKTIAAGEGGGVTTNDPALAERVTRLRNHGMTRDPADFQNAELARAPDGSVNPWYYEMPEPGWNYRLTDIQAALGGSQLRRLGRLVAQRRALAERYETLFAEAGLPLRPIARVSRCLPAWHLFPVLIDFATAGTSRGDVMRALADAGVGSQVHYIPVHRQPYYAARNPGLSLPGADAYYHGTLSLPLFAGMSAADVDRVVGTLARILSYGEVRAKGAVRMAAGA
jgi:UDP-4-amino-4,6-dideoxy-N-acetyl-beta-L-altrosamine transaminase